ncbi:MAG: NUDIX domain-containing protein [Solirubrobacteraceae bacterium]|nr:NUDIX domain-containing protein [Solirubrobacteraceae bacterium]
MERPTTGERLRREGAPTPPRQSASLIVVRDAAGGLELLLVRRNPAQRFMGGFWVFPGGAVDGAESHRAAAVRELAEEAGLEGIAPATLIEYSRWITPELIEIRFDTRFFLARAPDGERARVDGEECIDLRWTTPRAALAAYEDDELALVFPTLRHLEELAAFATVDELLAHARGREIRAIMPRVVLDGPRPRIVLPGEPGYA